MFDLTEQEVEALENLRNNDGFRVLRKIMRMQAEVVDNVRSIESETVLFFRKGQLDILDTINNLDRVVEVLSRKEDPDAAND